MDSESSLMEKYRERLKQEFLGNKKSNVTTGSYKTFREEQMPKHLSMFEYYANLAGKMLRISPSKKESEKVTKQLELSHLHTTPTGVTSLAIIMAFLFGVITSGAGIFLLSSIPVLLTGLIGAVVLFLGIQKLPEYFANIWRLRASNQMVQCVFYLITYMRHTANLEQAIRFASEHITPPLAVDLKKILWDVETGRYSSIEEALEIYLKKWQGYNPEFIEAIHLIEGSLYESSEQRRLESIDKALKVMLQDTYENMLRYAHNLKNPLTMLYMLGVVLPILGLVILPMVAGFMTTDINPLRLAAYIALIYNVALPLTIYLMGKATLSKRPTGYGKEDISEQYPVLKNIGHASLNFFKQKIFIKPKTIAWTTVVVFFAIGIFPLIFALFGTPEQLLQEKTLLGSFKFLGYRESLLSNTLIGPYGLGSTVLSFAITLSVGLGLGIYYLLTTKNIIKVREHTKRLEQEFSSALFQLGSRLADGIPLEIAFEKVAKVTANTETGKFFHSVTRNMRELGMSPELALFDSKVGAVHRFPSRLINSSMKVLIESSRKGPSIASQTMINVAEYIKDIHRVDERLGDLLSELISDIKQQVRILAPAIAGIVVGISAMIVTLLGNLSDQLTNIAVNSGTASSVPSGLLELFGDGIPAYYLQIIVGIYIVQINLHSYINC